MYHIGETKRIVAQFTDEKGALLLANTAKIQIKNAAGIQVSFRNMTLDSTGNFYFYDWTIPVNSDMGDYVAVIKGTYAWFVSMGYEIFKVSEAFNEQIWKAQLADNMNAGTFGEAITRILGLTQQNIRMSNHIYDEARNLLSCTVSIFRNPTDVDNNTNVIATYQMAATYDINNRLTNYKLKEQ